MAMTWPDAGNSDSFPTFTNEEKTNDGTSFGNVFGEFPSSMGFGEAFPPVASSGLEAAWPSFPHSSAPVDFGASSTQGWGFDGFDGQGAFESSAKNQSNANVPVPKARQNGKQGRASKDEANGCKLPSKERMEMQRRIALQDRVPALKRYAAELGEELGSLRAYAERQALAAEQCIGALHSRSQELAAELIKMQTAGPVSAEAIRQRQAVIREEARVLERRMEVEKFGGTNGPSWAIAEVEKRKALEARISGAKEREAAALEASLTEMKKSEQKIAMLRVEKRELESRPNLEVGPTWKSRYEGFASAQKALADRAAAVNADPGASRLDQALSAASAAAGAATGNHATGFRKPPEYLVQATKMLCGLAEAERRRGGLLVEKWRELHGNAPFNNVGSPDPAVFSPSPAYAWDLDVCRNTS